MKMFIKKLRLEVLFIIYLSLSSHLLADNHNIYETIEQLQKDYGEVIDSLRSYPYNASKMCEDYLKLFEEMYSNKKNYLGMRKYYLSSNVFSKSFYKLNRKINL